MLSEMVNGIVVMVSEEGKREREVKDEMPGVQLVALLAAVMLR